MANQRGDPGPVASQGNAEVVAQRLLLGQVNVRDAYSRSRGAGETDACFRAALPHKWNQGGGETS